MELENNLDIGDDDLDEELQFEEMFDFRPIGFADEERRSSCPVARTLENYPSPRRKRARSMHSMPLMMPSPPKLVTKYRRRQLFDGTMRIAPIHLRHHTATSKSVPQFGVQQSRQFPVPVPVANTTHALCAAPAPSAMADIFDSPSFTTADLVTLGDVGTMPELCSTKSDDMNIGTHCASRSPSPISQENVMSRMHCERSEWSRNGRALSSASDNMLSPQISPQQPSSVESCDSLLYFGRRRSSSVDSCGSLNFGRRRAMAMVPPEISPCQDYRKSSDRMPLSPDREQRLPGKTSNMLGMSPMKNEMHQITSASSALFR